MGKSKKKNAIAMYGDDRIIIGVDDMVLLSSVSEHGVLENLKIRHASDLIYTFIGHVLVVVNPYKWLQIYDEGTMKQYVHKARIDVVPHVFAIAEASYRAMISEEENQCVIISGESGAGKTEASKQIQNYIAAMSGTGKGVDKVKRVFLQSNPLLEAFGNAKTLRNNNSSRFGKYFELSFDTAGRPMAGKVTNYLLEKSRVVKPGKGERNFHIFYQLFAGLPSAVQQKLHLTSAQDYTYLNGSKCFTVEDIDDSSEFTETMAAMTHVGIKRKQVELVLQIVAAVLHLGNVTFSPLAVGDAEGSVIGNKQALVRFCELTGMDAVALEHALCYKLLQTMAPGGKMESYKVPQNPSQANAARDSIAKIMYERLFDFLVSRINAALDIEKTEKKSGQSLNLEEMKTIGILDIYGFEIFEKNGFEQFCINYVNEKLQQIFIELTLKSEQEEYEREGISWTPIPFFNNKVVCDLIEAKRPPGIFLVLDDTIKTMHSRQGASVDSTFLDKLSSCFPNHAHFSKRGKTFEIKHYAGEVQYSVEHFGDSNKDSLNKDIAILISTSSNKLITYMFPEEIDLLNDKRMPKTAGYKIRTQCGALVEALMECSPHYVRCMKSNDSKQANRIDDKRLVHQAQYLGILENIKVRRAGYAYRGEYGRFVDRFRLLSKETYPEFRGSDKKGCKAILKAAASSLPELQNEVQLGKSMVFIQTPECYFNLEKLRERKIGSFAKKIQKQWRKYSQRRHFLGIQAEMASLYAAEHKGRQRCSMFRPYDSDYLRDEDVRDGILAILAHYDDNETFLFLDTVEKAIATNTITNTTTGLPTSSRLVAITDDYLYIFEKRWWTPNRDKIKSTWQAPLVYLRRRLPLSSVEGIVLSTCADPFVILRIAPHVLLPTPDKSNWIENSSVKACMATKKPFGLFNRRHHCRVTGKILCDDVCAQLHVVPDRGYYTPQRVYDNTIGFDSTELPEDQCFLSEKKTEIVAVLVDAIQKKLGRTLSVTFEDTIVLRCAPVPALVATPTSPLVFTTHAHLSTYVSPPSTVKGNPIQVHVPSGVPEAFVKARRKREKSRMKKMEAKRAEESASRAARKANRETERETERLQRLSEKKMRKKAEREAKEAASAKKQGSSANTSRTFGESAAAAKPSGVNSELAAILARRRGQN